jgi:hypothetical protein
MNIDPDPNTVYPVKELAAHYAAPLPQIQKTVEECRAKVEWHMRKMGFEVETFKMAGGRS